MRRLRLWLAAYCLSVAFAGYSGGQEPPEPEDADAPTDPSVVAVERTAQPSVQERYSAHSQLPDFPVGVVGGSGILSPPGGTYYDAPARHWLQAEYLLWWLEEPRLPVLAESASGDSIVGGGRLSSDHLDGLRIRGGSFFDCDGVSGLMVDYFNLGTGGGSQSATGAGSTGSVLPYTDMDLSLPSNQVNGCGCLEGLEGTAASVPLGAAGSVTASTSSDLWSGGLAYRGRLNSWYACQRTDCCCQSGVRRCGHRLDGFIGYRYLSFDEGLAISSVLTPATGSVSATDRFWTENDFHGVDFGLAYEHERGRWGLELVSRLGLGITRQQLTIAGEGNRGGGLFAQYTNIGSYEHDAFTVIPELNATVNYAICRCLRARVGYSFLWLTNVIRPGTQVDTQLDGRFFDVTEPLPLNNPLAFFPRAEFETESMWLQGLSFGLEGWF